MRYHHLLSLLLIILTSCSPAVSQNAATQPVSSTQTTVPTEQIASTKAAQPTGTPYPTFPLGIHDTLPDLQPIDSVNVSAIIPIARVNVDEVFHVQQNIQKDRLMVQTGIGVYSIDKTSFASTGFTPLPTFLFDSAISPDGTMLAMMQPGSPNMWDAKLVVADLTSGKTICSQGPIFMGTAADFVFLEDNSLAFRVYFNNGSSDYRIMRVQLPTCQVMFDKLVKMPIFALSVDGETAAFGEEDKLFLYPTSGGPKKMLAEIPNMLGTFFLPGDTSILVTTKSGNSIFDLASGEKVLDFPGQMGKYFVNYAVSPDGDWIFILGLDQNRAFNLEENKLYTLPPDFTRLAPSGENVIRDHIITNEYIWSIRQQRKVASIKSDGLFLNEKRVLVSADGAYAAVSSTTSPYHTDVIDLTTGKVIHTLDGYRNPIALPSGNGFIATRQDKTAFFKYGSDQPQKEIDLTYENGMTIDDGTLLVWDTLGQITEIDVEQQSIQHATNLGWIEWNTPVENYLSSWSQGQGEAFHGFVDSFVQMPFGTNTHWTTRETISHDRSIIIRQTEKGRVNIYKTSQASLTWREYSETDLIASASVPSYPSQFVFSPDDRMVAGVYAQKVYIWDTQTGKQLQTLTLPLAVWRVYGLEFTPDGSRLAISASEDTPGEDPGFSIGIHRSIVLRVIDLQSGRILQVHKLEQKFRKSGCNIALPFVLNSDGTQVITFTPNCKPGIYDINTWELLGEFGDSISDANIDLALSPDNQLLAMTYKDRLELWDLSTGSMIKRFTNPGDQVFPHFRDADLSYMYQVAFSPNGRLIGTRFGWNSTQPGLVTLWGVPE